MAAKRSSKEYSNAEAVDIIHQVANLYISTKVPQDYGTGEEYTSVEVHTLKHIADNPGITVTELTKLSCSEKIVDVKYDEIPDEPISACAMERWMKRK